MIFFDELKWGIFERWWRGGLPLLTYFMGLLEFIKNNTPKNTPKKHP